MKSPLLNMDDASELLFFDTFSHANCELNLDLVQFPQAVTIVEIRIIPLGARVQADFPGGHRLGATNPSAFRLEFFVNDLSNRRACTFQSLGSLDYKQNVEIQFLAPKKISTDGLVLKGLYNAVTIAVYGLLNKEDEKDHLSARQTPPLPQTVRSQPLDHRQIHDSTSLDWDRHPRPIEAVSEPPQPIHPRSQAIVEGPRFAEGPPIIHPQPESHVQYSAEIPPAYSESPSTAYNECIPSSVPPPSPYSSYDGRFSKPWPTSEEHFPPHDENYNQPVYNRPPEGGSYAPPPIPASHTIWDAKDCHSSSSEMVRPEHDPYDHKIHSRDKERDRRDKPWERDSHSSEDNSRDRNYKRRERDHRSWECNSPDRYRDRDRIKDSSSHDRDRDRNRDAGREKSRNHDNYGDRPRLPVKRPTTPPTPPPLCTKPKTPQTPPEPEKPIGGPRTPKEEEPNEPFEEMDVPHNEPYYGNLVSPEQRVTETMYNLSEGEIQEGDNTEDDDGYEEIVSEEEIMSDSEERTVEICGDIEYDPTDESWNYMSSFSPYACELVSFQHFKDPTLSNFEFLENKTKDCKAKEVKKENNILEMVKLFDGKKHTEKWIEALESLNSGVIAENLLSIDSEQAYDDAVVTLIDWVIEGLNYDLALQQPQAAYKIRHIKAGIHMATLLFQTNSNITSKLLNAKIPMFLLQLFDQPSMTLPLKLHILRALDAVTYTIAGYDFLLTKVLEFSPPMNFDLHPKKTSKNDAVNDKGVNSKTGYQKLLELMLSKQLTRAIVSISALLEKIHLYETIQKLKEAIESIAANNQSNETKSASEEPPPDSGAQPEKQEAEMEVANDNVINPAAWESTIQVIVTCLNDITLKYKKAWTKLTQQKRNLPSNSCFEVKKSPIDPYPGILRLFKESHLLGSLSVLFTNSILSNHPAVISSARDLFSEFLHSQNGMLYLLSNPEIINNIQKSLLQNIEENREETSDDNIAQNLGIQIVCHLQALLYVDSLQKYHSKGNIRFTYLV